MSIYSLNGYFDLAVITILQQTSSQLEPETFITEVFLVGDWSGSRTLSCF